MRVNFVDSDSHFLTTPLIGADWWALMNSASNSLHDCHYGERCRLEGIVVNKHFSLLQPTWRSKLSTLALVSVSPALGRLKFEDSSLFQASQRYIICTVISWATE